MECSPFVVCWMGETDRTSITVTSSSHVSSCSPSLLPLVGICDDSIRSGTTGTASLGRLDRTDRTEGCTPSVSITGASIELRDSDLILETGPLIGLLDRAGNDVETKSVSTSLVGCVLVNMTSRWESEGIEVGSWFGQSIVGSVVSSCSNHLYGTSIRSLHGGGSLLSLNSSFVSCLLDATNENKPFTTQTILSADHSLFSFTLCTFKGCTAYHGGALNSNNINVSVSINSCSFDSCSSSDAGGALSIVFPALTTSTVTLKSSSFTSCSGAGDASLRVYSPCSSTISECVFIESEAARFGGAIDLYKWDPATKGGAFSNCLFLNCQQTDATSPYGGGVMFFQYCPSVQLSSLLFDECSASTGIGHVIYHHSSPYPTLNSKTVSSCASSSDYASSLIFVSQTGQDFSALLNQSPTSITLTALTAKVKGTAADVEVTLNKAVSGTLLVVLSNAEGERVEVTDGIPNIGRVLEFSMSSSIGSCSVSIGETGLLQTPLSDYSIVAAFLPGHIMSLPTLQILNASCRLGNGPNHAWIQLTGVNIAPGTYTMTLVGMSDFSFDVTFSGATDEHGRPLSEEMPVRLFGEGNILTFGTEYQIDAVIHNTSKLSIFLGRLMVSFITPAVASRIIGLGKETLILPQKDSVSVPLSGADMKDTTYLVEVSLSDVVLDAPFSAVFSANSGTLVGRVYSASGSVVPLEYGKTYGVVSVTNSEKDAVLFNPFSFTVPAEPARIKTIASTKLNREKTEVIVELTGVKFFASSALFVHLKKTNTGRAFSSSLTIKTAESCSMSFLTAQSEDDTHLQFGLDYLVTSIASVDGLSSFLFSEGLEVTVPSAPIVDTISSSLSPSCTTFQVSMTGSHLPLTGSFTATLSPTATMTVNFVDGVGTTPWLSDGVDGMKLNTTYTIIELSNDNDVILVNQKTFTTPKGPTLLSIDTPTLKSDNLNVIVLTLNGERMPLKATVSEFLLVVVEKDQSTEISIPVSFSTNWLGGGEAVAYPSSTLKYSTAYSVLRMTSTTVPVSIPSTVSFSTPAAPTRIISALGSLDTETGKTVKISLTGIGFPQSTDFAISVLELDSPNRQISRSLFWNWIPPIDRFRDLCSGIGFPQSTDFAISVLELDSPNRQISRSLFWNWIPPIDRFRDLCSGIGFPQSTDFAISVLELDSPNRQISRSLFWNWIPPIDRFRDLCSGIGFPQSTDFAISVLELDSPNRQISRSLFWNWIPQSTDFAISVLELDSPNRQISRSLFWNWIPPIDRFRDLCSGIGFPQSTDFAISVLELDSPNRQISRSLFWNWIPQSTDFAISVLELDSPIDRFRDLCSGIGFPNRQISRSLFWNWIPQSTDFAISVLELDSPIDRFRDLCSGIGFPQSTDFAISVLELDSPNRQISRSLFWNWIPPIDRFRDLCSGIGFPQSTDFAISVLELDSPIDRFRDLCSGIGFPQSTDFAISVLELDSPQSTDFAISVLELDSPNRQISRSLFWNWIPPIDRFRDLCSGIGFPNRQISRSLFWNWIPPIDRFRDLCSGIGFPQSTDFAISVLELDSPIDRFRDLCSGIGFPNRQISRSLFWNWIPPIDRFRDLCSGIGFPQSTDFAISVLELDSPIDRFRDLCSGIGFPQSTDFAISVLELDSPNRQISRSLFWNWIPPIDRFRDLCSGIGFPQSTDFAISVLELDSPIDRFRDLCSGIGFPNRQISRSLFWNWIPQSTDFAISVLELDSPQSTDFAISVLELDSPNRQISRSLFWNWIPPIDRFRDLCSGIGFPQSTDFAISVLELDSPNRQISRSLFWNWIPPIDRFRDLCSGIGFPPIDRFRDLCSGIGFPNRQISRSLFWNWIPPIDRFRDLCSGIGFPNRQISRSLFWNWIPPIDRFRDLCSGIGFPQSTDFAISVLELDSPNRQISRSLFRDLCSGIGFPQSTDFAISVLELDSPQSTDFAISVLELDSPNRQISRSLFWNWIPPIDRFRDLCSGIGFPQSTDFAISVLELDSPNRQISRSLFWNWIPPIDRFRDLCSGIGFPQSTDFAISVLELDDLSQPTGSPIELSSSCTADGSSTSHTLTVPIFGETSAKLQFDKSYVITDLFISGMRTVVESDVTFKVPAEPSRLISIGSATYSNQDREVSVSLSGVKLLGTYWIVLESNTCTADVNVSVSFSESGIGELKGILYSKALPLSMNMTYDTEYKIVGMEDSSPKPIFFESGLTFETMKEPTRIEDGKYRLNPVRDKVIVTLTGRALSPGCYSVVLTHSEASKSRTITGNVNTEGNVECSHTVDTIEANSLVFGETYSISSAHRDGTAIHVNSDLSLKIPNEPKVKGASFSFPSSLHTSCIVTLSGSDLDLQGSYSVALVDGPSFTILFNAESKVNSPPLLIGLQDTLQFDTNYTLKSITNVEPERDTVLLDDPVWFKTGVRPTNMTLYVDENAVSDRLFCGETVSPCTTVDIAWKIAEDLLISKVELKVMNSTTQSTSLVIPSNGFLILSKDQLTGPTLRIPSAASMGERKGICSIVGSAQTSNGQEYPEDMCSWESGILQVVNSSTTITSSLLTHLSQGAINMEGGHLSILVGTFTSNTPINSVFPSFRRNIHCSNTGNITIENLNGGDGTPTNPSTWISTDDCSLASTIINPDTLLFIPTLSSDSKSNQDKKSKVFSIELSGSVLIPCGIWLEIVEITKSKTEGNIAKLELTSETCKSHTENLISLELPPSLVKDLDSSLEWQGRLIFGNAVRSSTSFVIQKSSADKRSEAVRDNMKWWIPLVIVIVVALLVFVVILVILLRRRQQKKTAKSSEMTEINTMVRDRLHIIFEEVPHLEETI
ncbi:hypothetical protein BLNAU_10005 [Blattamonas nauphoetae]|uniref:Uncharacterized protein n=1 Tax=Blattamonas nauphoetae TaxID=2049346 RepID=A0ABQ9XUB6_9EUKA|nr:hypothetical protein BLNAU_10005 [Blattamonas nauphoetae]